MFKELIWVKKNSLSKTFCNNVIEKFEDEPKKRPGKIGGVPPDYNGRVDKSVKDTTDLLITKVSGWEEEDGIFYKALQEGLKEYQSYLSNIHINCSPNYMYNMRDAGYKLQKYEPDGFYDWHNDWSMK